MKAGLIGRLEKLERAKEQRKASENVINSVDIVPHIAPIYHDLHDDIRGGIHSVYNLPGGRGSCKSSFVSLEIVGGIMSDKTGQSSAIVFRRWASSMRDSVFAQISWAIDVLGVSHLWRGTFAPMCYTYLPTGAQIVFRGLDDPSKLKSLKPAQGVFKYVWFEEFSELAGAETYRNVLQSAVRGGNSFTIFRSFNPPLSVNNWANQIIMLPDNKAITLRTSYLDVPSEWLGEMFLHEAERLKIVNERAYRHEYLGEAVGSGGAVFPNIETRTLTDKEIDNLQYIFCGLDFGFAVDPAAFVRVAYDNHTDTLYILDEIYGRGLSNKALADKIRNKGYDLTGNSHLFYHIDGSISKRLGKQPIICDSAEPKSISDLRNEGLKCLPAAKGAGSVLYGIKWLQHRKIVIDPERTPNAYREFVTYEYSRTRDGEFLADVPDKDNHTIDAVRYALEPLIKKRTISA